MKFIVESSLLDRTSYKIPSSLDIVERHIKPIEKSNKNVTTDNWYTCVPLAEESLLVKDLTLVETMKKNKTEQSSLLHFYLTNIRKLEVSCMGFNMIRLVLFDNKQGCYSFNKYA